MGTNRTLLRVTALLALAVPSVSLTVAAHAATARVAVIDNAYDPADVVISAGDAVTWVWEGDAPHSVTAADGSFDSHPSCSPAAPASCGTNGAVYTRTFREAGSVRYVCRFHGPAMTGTITIEPPSEPEPEPSATPSPSSSPSPSPSPSATPPPPPSPDPSPSPEPTRTAQPTRPPSPSPSATPSPSGAPSPSADPSEAPDDPSPSPTPTTSLEAFPSPSATPDDVGEVAVDLPDGGGGGGRTAALALGTVAVLGSAAAFGKLILFGEPWDG